MAQYHQKFPLPQYVKTVRYQTAMKPWNHIKTNAYQIVPTVVSPLFSLLILKIVMFHSRSMLTNEIKK